MHTGGDHAASTFRVLPSSPPIHLMWIDRPVPPRRPPARGVPRRPPSHHARRPERHRDPPPGSPGTYMVLVTVIDACNSHGAVATNVTRCCRLCAVVAVSNRTRRPALESTRGDGPGERDARVRVVARARPGRFSTRLREADEQYYYRVQMRRYDAISAGRLRRRVFRAESSAPVTIINDGSPQPLLRRRRVPGRYPRWTNGRYGTRRRIGTSRIARRPVCCTSGR